MRLGALGQAGTPVINGLLESDEAATEEACKVKVGAFGNQKLAAAHK